MIDNIINKNEKVIWEGKPNRFLYSIGSPARMLIAIIFLVVEAFIFSRMYSLIMIEFEPLRNGPIEIFNQAHLIPVFIIPTILLIIPIVIIFIQPLYRFFEYTNVEYVVTDKRVYISSGLIGRDIANIEYDEIDKLSVNVNLLEKIFSVGTVRLTPDTYVNSGDTSRRILGYRLRSIKKSYEVFKTIKDLSLDVTTDQQFPNQFRPKENPGYNTSWKRDK